MAKTASKTAKKKTTLLIVESPSKATTIKGYLGTGYKVVASVGHIRDLPKSTLGVDIENHFTPHYINIRGKGDVIKGLRKEAKSASRVLLATDPDREGEAISWHIAQELGIDETSACRVTFNEITKQAVKASIKTPRRIDSNLVDAQQARRILDRIVGYKLSPFLWKKVKSGLSAGRVQSVATRIITEREEEIRAFVPKEYWTISAILENEKGEKAEARFFGNKEGKIRLNNEAQAASVLEAVKGKAFLVDSVTRTQKQRQPSPPFITSTLQQEAYHKLNFRSQRTMKIAQELYEGVHLGNENGGIQGLITYMRTDSLRISSTAQETALAFIEKEYGKEYLPKTPRVYKTASAAQDAHEAIRPANIDLTPALVRKYLTPDQNRLYKLIWERFIASQMAAAIYDAVSVDFSCGGYIFKTSGSHLRFCGYTAVYDNAELEQKEEEQNASNLPHLEEGKQLSLQQISPTQHFTEPPLRYTEASLIKFLEENGIGRPSTYTAIITTILTRGYVKREGKNLLPTPLGEVTNRVMKENFPSIVDYAFTADMETRLDEIEQGTENLENLLSGFYQDFALSLQQAQEKIDKEDVEIPPDVSPYTCDLCGNPLIYKVGRFGKFLACSNYPACHNTKTIDKDGNPVEKEKKAPEKADFACPQCGGDVVLRHGKFGVFYACVNYPKCTFTKQKVDRISILCPDCQSPIVIKRGKNRFAFYSCERYPECQFSTWDIPTEEKCPDCGDMLLRRKGKKVLYCRNKECGYKADEKETTEEA
ncbi:MAG: type I DNA topoisomerase [Clostridia bacterium]|nr:type I DNA topoisomerase [Clostridia bacterium]